MAEPMEPSGVLIIKKTAGMTSHDVVNKIRRLYNTRSVGHTGTLDPMATGVLVVMVGRAVKASEYLVCDAKSYRATLRLGLTTDSEDTTGTLLSTSESIPTESDLQAVLSQFLGKIQQIPPMYSALKVNGQKLVDLARRGETVERQPREIEIFSLSATPTASPADYLLDVSCSSGTYIRTLCADIGKKLGCGGVMASLERTETGGFSLKEAHALEELEAMDLPARQALLIPAESLFSSLPAVRLAPFFEKLIRGGCAVSLKKLKVCGQIGDRIRLQTEMGDFFALGEITESEEEPALKSIKIFVL